MDLLTAAIEKQQDSLLIVEMNPDNPFWPGICYANASFLALTGYDPTIVTGETYACQLSLCGHKFSSELVQAALEHHSHRVATVHRRRDRQRRRSFHRIDNPVSRLNRCRNLAERGDRLS